VEEDSQVIEADIRGTTVAGLDEEYVDEMDERVDDISDVKHSLENATLSELEPVPPITVGEDATVAEVIATMRAKNIGSVIIVDEAGKITGLFTERDVLNRVACQIKDLSKAKIAKYMTVAPTVLKPDTTVAHALNQMAVNGFRHLPLVDGENHPVGVVSFRDVVAYIERWFAP